MADYDIGAAFEAIEDELIASMMRNLSRHRAEEDKEGLNWTMWQVEQLKYLEQYKKANQEKYADQFRSINQKIDEMLRKAKAQGNTEQEQEILEAIKNGFKGFKHSADSAMTGEFFRLNERKLEALIKATTDDMQKAETAILRMANDQYRKAIYNAQVYANTGAGTYEKAVDMATKSMLAAGLNCIEYANGARHTLEDYADMAIRTASKRAYLQGEGEKRQEWGVTTVILNKRLNPCPKCLPWVGKVLIDDVWSGGSKDGKSNVTGLKYPLMSTAIEAGLYHPRCKDSHTTYFEGISTPPTGSKYTREELNELAEQYQKEQKQQYAERQAKKYSRLEKYSLDPDNKQIYGARADEWGQQAEWLKSKQETIAANQISGSFWDATEDWFRNASPNSQIIEELKEYTVNGVTYKIDGVNVKQNNSERELQVAELLRSTFGGDIKLVPEINGKYLEVQTPDYIYNGERYDLKELTGKSKDAIRNAIHKKGKQAENFIIDVTNNMLSMEEINRQAEAVFTSFNTKFVNKLIIVKGDKILRILQRK